MPSVTGGGASNISGSQIVDGTISNVDIATNAAIALSKISGLLADPGSLISIEAEAAASHSLTTVANQRVLVFARASASNVSAGEDATLTYNGVTKDTVHVDTGGSADWGPFFLMYTEVPGAGTHPVAINGSSGNELIVVIKLMVG